MEKTSEKNLKNRVLSVLSENITAIMFACVVVAVMLYMISGQTIDSDTNFILYEGERIADAGIQYWNTAAVCGAMRTVVQQWLYDLITYVIYRKAGWHGLFSFNVVQAFILGALLFRLATVSGNRKKASLIASAVSLWAFISNYGSTRPEMITGILLAENAILMERYANTSRVKYVLMCLPLVILEANLHASMWIMHVAVMLPYAIPYREEMERFGVDTEPGTVRSYRHLPVILAIALSPLCALANPYGTEGVMYLFRSAGMNLKAIGVLEMQYPFLAEYHSIFYLAVLILAVKYIKETKPEHDLLFAGSFFAFALAYRNIIFLSVLSVPLIASVLASLSRRHIRRNSAENSNIQNGHRLFPLMEILIIAVSAFIGIHSALQPLVEKDSPMFPVKAEKYIIVQKRKLRTDRPARIMTHYDNGAYFERMGENIYIDARPEIWRKKINGKADIYNEFMSVKKITAKQYRKMKKKYEFDYIIAHNGSVLQARCQNDSDAVLAVRGNGYALYRLKSGSFSLTRKHVWSYDDFVPCDI